VLLAQPLHGLRRVRQGRPAGAERAGDILRRLRAQLHRGPVEQRALLVGLGRVELEGNGNAGRRETGDGRRHQAVTPGLANRLISALSLANTLSTCSFNSLDSVAR